MVLSSFFPVGGLVSQGRSQRTAWPTKEDVFQTLAQGLSGWLWVWSLLCEKAQEVQTVALPQPGTSSGRV